jgi:Ca2+-binding EF-hand superfamily protein
MYPNLSQDDIQSITDFFNFVDTNKDGLISVSEITSTMTVTDSLGVTHDNSQEWLSVYFIAEDFNHDQLISLSELLQYNNDTKNQVRV